MLGSSLSPTFTGGSPNAAGGCILPLPALSYSDTVVSTLAKKKKQITPPRQNPQGVTAMEEEEKGILIYGEASTYASIAPTTTAARRSGMRLRSPSFGTSNLVVQSTSTTSDTQVDTPDFSMAVGIQHIVYGVNAPNGSLIYVYDDKSNVAGPPTGSLYMNSLGAGAVNCSGGGGGEPQVLWDHEAQRWLFSERGIAGTQSLCFYLSSGPDPLASTYHTFSYFFTGGEAQFHKTAVWGSGVYAITLGSLSAHSRSLCVLDRTSLLEWTGIAPPNSTLPPLPTLFCGAPFTGPLAGFSASSPTQVWTPVHAHGAAPPLETQSTGTGSAGAVFMRVVDDELHEGASTPAVDRLSIEHWYAINFTTTSYFALRYSVNIADVRSNAGTVPNPGAYPFEAVREPLMPRLVYRYIPATGQQSIVGTLVSHVDMGARPHWFELRWESPMPMVNPLWILHGQGVVGNFTADAQHRWLPSVSMDANGTIVVAYNEGSSVNSPSLYMTNRLANDPLGELRSPLLMYAGDIGATLPATAVWGRTTALESDPVDARYFYLVGQHATVGGPWMGSISRIRVLGEVIQRNWTAYDSCDTPPATCVQMITCE